MWQVSEVKALIGFFDLDPNRVYDLVLDAFEAAAAPAGNAAVFLALARLFSSEARVQLLGFKFQQLTGDREGTQPSLYLVAAHLVKASMPSTDALQPVDLFYTIMQLTSWAQTHVHPPRSAEGLHMTSVFKHFWLVDVASPSACETRYWSAATKMMTHLFA
jgi:hypothetical protein